MADNSFPYHEAYLMVSNALQRQAHDMFSGRALSTNEYINLHLWIRQAMDTITPKRAHSNKDVVVYKESIPNHYREF